MSNTAIPKVQVSANAPSDEQPEVDVSDEEFLQFDTSGVPVIITLTKARHSRFSFVLNMGFHDDYVFRVLA